MGSIATGVAQILADAGLGVIASSTGWRIGVGAFIDKPDTQIICYDVGGSPSNPKWLLDYPAVQIMFRGAPQGYAAVAQKADDATDVLLGQFPRTVNGDLWDSVTMLSSSSFVGNDQNARPQFSMTMRLIVEPAPSALTNRLPLGT